MIDFTNYPLAVIFVVSLALLLAAAEIGHQFGLRVAREANVSTLEAAILGLLALMISFTFSMALTRFEARRDALLSEANAIGTSALRAHLLPAPHGEQSLKLLKDYVQIRLDSTAQEYPPAGNAAALLRSNTIQQALWRQVEAAVAKDNAMVPMGLYIQALNKTFDDQAKRLTALRNLVPNIVLIALYGIAVVALGFAGYASGIERRRWRLPVYIMSALVAAVILLIQERPNAGFISISQQPMIDAARALDGYSADLGVPAPSR